ncbi:MAG: SET domain-containing protein [Candidatus Dormibacteria bacterium]
MAGPAAASYISPKCEKRAQSLIDGWGLYSLATIAKGEVVAVKGGHLVDHAARQAQAQVIGNSDIQITDELYLVALEGSAYHGVMLYLNHSCEPNVGVAGNVVFVAMRDIATGEELTIDYAMIDDHQESLICRCGTVNCRGIVAGQDWQRPELQERYGCYFSWYLQAKAGLLP